VIHSPPPQWIDQATHRLMLDGRTNAALRQSIARLLARWEGNREQSLSQAERLLWSGQVEASVGMINELVRDEPNGGELARKGAELLQGSGDAAAMKEAIRLWDQLAAGTAQGSPLWHEAKLAAIAALNDAGNVAEAHRRANYVLLTSPKMTDDLRRQYESFAK
jgi:thioredoxin-like negative regulator of GroEL